MQNQQTKMNLKIYGCQLGRSDAKIEARAEIMACKDNYCSTICLDA